jgi:hypothetical protein
MVSQWTIGLLVGSFSGSGLAAKGGRVNGENSGPTTEVGFWWLVMA